VFIVLAFCLPLANKDGPQSPATLCNLYFPGSHPLVLVNNDHGSITITTNSQPASQDKEDGANDSG